MNNGQISQEQNNEIVVEPIVYDTTELQSDREYFVRMLKHLSALKNSPHFVKFVKEIIFPERDRRQALLNKEKDPIEMYRLQGFIEALKWVITIEKFEKNYKSKLDRNYGESKTK